MNPVIDVGGPYIEQLHHGQRFADAPPVTLTDGLNTAYQAIAGNRLHLVSDQHLAKAVTGGNAALANPALVWNVAMGQSTTVTGRVVANLFYRGLRLHRIPVLGDTLSSVTTVEKLRANKLKPGRRPTGLVQLRVQTVDQEERKVLDFHRCAMLPFSNESAAGAFEYADDVTVVASDDDAPVRLSLLGWDLVPWRKHVRHTAAPSAAVGTEWSVTAGDVVSSAPELARLTMNTAAVHHDRYATGGDRLVYGGHTIGIAFHHLLRCVPQVLAVIGWDYCDHTGPVMEGDTLTSLVSLIGDRPYEAGSRELTIRVRTSSRRETSEPHDVLDWQLRVLIAEN